MNANNFIKNINPLLRPTSGINTIAAVDCEGIKGSLVEGEGTYFYSIHSDLSVISSGKIVKFSK